jgi:hypothetical protein
MLRLVARPAFHSSTVFAAGGFRAAPPFLGPVLQRFRASWFRASRRRSLLHYRMARLGLGRMPHTASNVVDEQGEKLIRDWIKRMGE